MATAMHADKRATCKEERCCPPSGSLSKQGFRDSLRAVHVTVNEAARQDDFAVFENIRVPESSIIHRVFYDVPHGEAVENMSSWKTSNGFTLPDRLVIIKAKKSSESVDALIIPKNDKMSARPKTAVRS